MCVCVCLEGRRGEEEEEGMETCSYTSGNSIRGCGWGFVGRRCKGVCVWVCVCVCVWMGRRRKSRWIDVDDIVSSSK